MKFLESLCRLRATCRLGRRIAGRPAFETLLAESQQALVIGKVEVESVLGRCIVFAIIVTVLAADHRPYLVDVAPAIRQQVLASRIEHQVPATLVLVDADTLVRNLPQQRFEIVFRPRRIDFLGHVSAAFGIGAEIAFTVIVSVAIDLDFGKFVIHA